MSAKGHKQTSRRVRGMSVIPLKADIHQRGLHVRLVPITDIPRRPTAALISFDRGFEPRPKTMASIRSASGCLRAGSDIS